MKKIYKTGEIISIFTALEDFASKDIALSAQLAWDIENNRDELGKVVGKFEKRRDELLKPLNDKDAFEPVDDTHFRVKPEHIEEYTSVMAKVDEFLDTENEIEIKTANRDSIPEMISVKDLRAIKFMIE